MCVVLERDTGKRWIFPVKVGYLASILCCKNDFFPKRNHHWGSFFVGSCILVYIINKAMASK